MSEYSQHLYRHGAATDHLGAQFLWSGLKGIEAETKTPESHENKVLPVTAEQLLYNRQFGSMTLKAMGEHQQDAVSYAGAGLPIEKDGREYVEIGTLVTKQADRGHHLASENLEAVLEQVVDNEQVPVAFANGNSIGIFLKHGFEIVPPNDYNEYPQEYFDACAECPALQYAQFIGDQCCDKLVIFPTED